MAYTDKNKVIDNICDEISMGKSLRSVLDSDGMPNRTTFFKWIDDDHEKSNQYTRAMELRAEMIFEDILTIADNQENDVIITDDENKIINHNVINRSKLRIDSRKWMLGKMMPKKYGDRMDLSSTDGTMSPSKKLTDNDKAQLMDEIKKGLDELNDY